MPMPWYMLVGLWAVVLLEIANYSRSRRQKPRKIIPHSTEERIENFKNLYVTDQIDLDELGKRLDQLFGLNKPKAKPEISSAEVEKLASAMLLKTDSMQHGQGDDVEYIAAFGTDGPVLRRVKK